MLLIKKCLHFKAYVNNPEDNKKKLIENVKKKGDVYFRSGDIVVMDKYGWLYFKESIFVA
jgi:hypothetical protein